LGHEHVDAVLARSRQEGSNRFLLVVIAHHADANGEWRTDQLTLQREVRLSLRRVQRILVALVASGELSLVSHHGRGKLSTFRIQVGEKPGAHAMFPPEKLGAEADFSTRKPGPGARFPAPLDPPFPPDPQIPLYPPETQETSGLRPLTGPQSAVLRVKLLLEEAGVPLPSPAQIGLWSKTLGGIEPLLDLLRRLIEAGLANKREPMRYVHRVVMERAAHPEPARPPLRAVKTRNPVLLAGSDETRRQLALQIIAKTGGKK
jgi:hypothetical protein